MKYIRLICIICVALISVEGFAQGKINRPQKSPTTSKQSHTTGTINGHEWVDLGLPSRVKWATCNVGASSPSDYGNYYAWGETVTKSEYTEENSKTYGNENIGIISGNPRYDAARANWGGTWRLPSVPEMKELIDKCTWTWTSQNGNKGYKVVGPNGKYIFLPAAGYRDELLSKADGNLGCYWSFAPYPGAGFGFACTLHFHDMQYNVGIDPRVYGESVRPVTK